MIYVLIVHTKSQTSMNVWETGMYDNKSGYGTIVSESDSANLINDTQYSNLYPSQQS